MALTASALTTANLYASLETMKVHHQFASTLLLITVAPCFSQAVTPESQAEALAACGMIQPEPLTPYGLAKSTLVSLWYARNAAERGNEIKQVGKEAENIFSFVTAMMRIGKMSTNDFLCAKRPLRPFTTTKSDDNVRTAAALMMVVYDAHISINERMNALLKNLGTTDQGELMDQISTLQVERSQRWSDLVQPTTLVLMMMVDLKRTDVPGKTTRLVITKAQKQTLIAWIDEHFPEFKNGTPKDQWSDPARTAELYIKMLEGGRKCADE